MRNEQHTTEFTFTDDDTEDWVDVVYFFTVNFESYRESGWNRIDGFTLEVAEVLRDDQVVVLDEEETAKVINLVRNVYSDEIESRCLSVIDDLVEDTY